MLEPADIATRLEEIEKDLGIRQDALAKAAHAWYTAKREQEMEHAKCFLIATGPVEARKAQATLKTGEIGKQEEADFEARKRAMMVLETRASILQTLAKVGR